MCEAHGRSSDQGFIFGNGAANFGRAVCLSGGTGIVGREDELFWSRAAWPAANLST
jgi:hypothetical protein